MARRTEPIRIRITSRERQLEPGDLREAFWAPLRQREAFSNQSVAQFEAKLSTEFGVALRDKLLDSLSEPLRKAESDVFPRALRDLDHWMFRFGPPEKEWYRYQGAEVVSKLLEYERDLLEGTPGLREARGKILAAAGVFFSAQIAGYSSLNLDLATGSFEKLAKVFDGHFDEFRVFLDVFVPLAFGDVFEDDFSSRLAFSSTIPQSVEDAFIEASSEAPTTSATSATPASTSGPTSVVATTRERAEWLWRLANGSLLIPVVIALVVMFYGVRMLSDIHRAQDEALRPILEYQLELLREDRSRLATAGGQTKAPSTEAATDAKKPAASGSTAP
jgi:hypothetical protein